MIPKQILIAKAIIAITTGLLVGYALGNSFAKDATKARTITMEEYVADFERYKAKLGSAEMPMPGSLTMGVILVFGAVGLYELVAFGLAKGLVSVGGRGSTSPSSSSREG